MTEHQVILRRGGANAGGCGNGSDGNDMGISGTCDSGNGTIVQPPHQVQQLKGKEPPQSPQTQSQELPLLSLPLPQPWQGMMVATPRINATRNPSTPYPELSYTLPANPLLNTHHDTPSDAPGDTPDIFTSSVPAANTTSTSTTTTTTTTNAAINNTTTTNTTATTNDTIDSTTALLHPHGNSQVHRNCSCILTLQFPFTH